MSSGGNNVVKVMSEQISGIRDFPQSIVLLKITDFVAVVLAFATIASRGSFLYSSVAFSVTQSFGTLGSLCSIAPIIGATSMTIKGHAATANEA